MATDLSFKQASSKNVRDIVRGDIILFKDPVLKWNWQRGIVYDPLYNTEEKRMVGFIVLPVDTTSKKDDRIPPFSFLEKTNPSIVQQAGGNPAFHKTLVQFNLRTVVNIGKMTGDEAAQEIRTLGSYAGSPYMVELLNEVEKLYHQQRLYKDNKRVVAETHVRILPRTSAEQEVRDNSKARRAAFERMREENISFGGTSVGKKLKPVLATLEEAESGGYISPRTHAFLKAARMKDTNEPPQTIMDAHALVTKQTGQLRQVYGLTNRGKIYRETIAEVKSAAKELSRLENNGGPA